MSNEFNELTPGDQIKAENDYLRMKLMLENGAEFSMMPGEDITPEMENDFLNYIAAFEKQSANPKYITVFERIGRPDFFKPVNEIPATDIEYAWGTLTERLEKEGISVAVCSPNITTKELYRFVTEELFKYEMDDLNIPGMVTTFIYDEFHPDPVYDNSRLVQEDLLRDIFGKNNLFFRIHYAKDGFQFNNHRYTEWNDYFKKVERFKSLFEEINLVETTVGSCTVESGECKVTGYYHAMGIHQHNRSDFKGSFMVVLKKGYLDYWEFSSITLQGFDIE